MSATSSTVRTIIKPRTICSSDVPRSNIECCVHCGSLSYKKIGKTSSGAQRFLCKDCHKSFTENYGLITHHTRLSEWQWKEAIRSTINVESITTLAKNMNVSTKTAWLCRMKIYQSIKNIYGYNDTFNSITEVDGKYERISFKGLKDKAYFLDRLNRMPRHHRSREDRIKYLGDNYNKLFCSKPGLLKHLIYDTGKRLNGQYAIDINHQHVCIITAIDRSNNIFIAPSTAGVPKSKDVYDRLSNKISSDAVLVSDNHASYRYLVKRDNLEHIVIDTTLHTNSTFSLARVNSLHSSLDRFLRGNEFLPATKYLDLYLMMFWWLEKNKDEPTVNLCESLYNLLIGYVPNVTRANMHPVTITRLNARQLPIDCKGYY